MQHLLSRSARLSLLVCMILICSCVKKVAGPKGETGAAGKTGNATQTHISSFNLQSSQWTLNGANWEAYIYDPRINTDILSSGDVEVYLQIGSSWHSLPRATGDIVTQYA